MVVGRIQNIGRTIWDHKKKTAFGGLLVYWGMSWVKNNQRNASIRTLYAQEALEMGNVKVSAESRPRRITILANTSANERHVWDEFSTNALPLFHLAGIEVNVIKTDSSDQLEKLSSVLDGEEADGLYIVGGDGTMQRVLTAIYKEKDYAPLPIGFAPGGYDCLALKSLVPTVFNTSTDVRRWCESAMSVIEDTRREVSITQTTVSTKDNEVPLIEYGLSPIYGGWFGHIEERRRKLWYWAGLKRRFAYFWEMLKRSPSPTVVSIEYEEFCPGCSSCRAPIVIDKPEWRWWHILTGRPKSILPSVQYKDYSKIMNESCGKKGEAISEAVEFNIHTEQIDDTSRLHLRAINGMGRIGVMREGWSRCSNDCVATSSNQDIYNTDIIARSINMTINAIPSFLSRVYIAGDSVKVEEGDSIQVKTTNKKAQIFLPSTLRINLDQVN